MVPAERVENTAGSDETLGEISKYMDVNTMLALILTHRKLINSCDKYSGTITVPTGFNPLIVPSMLVGASSWAYKKTKCGLLLKASRSRHNERLCTWWNTRLPIMPSP